VTILVTWLPAGNLHPRRPEFTIETRRKALPVYLDGEVVTLAPPLRYRNRPRALRVLLPAAAAE